MQESTENFSICKKIDSKKDYNYTILIVFRTKMHCIYVDNHENDEYPYAVRVPTCFCCGSTTSITARSYSSEFGKYCGKEYCNWGENFPVTACCKGPLCFRCIYEDNISCSFCGEKTHVSFLEKDDYVNFFLELDQFDEILKILGEQSTAFFRWHKAEYIDLHDWRCLYPNSDFVALVKEFKAVIACSKIALCKTICLSHAYPIFQKRFKEQRRIAAKFLGECYHARYPIVFQKRDVVSEYHFGFLRVLVARMSCSNTEPINRRIFLAITNSFAAKKFFLR
jgi:hypothetical protein